jgi:hypothetical protein
MNLNVISMIFAIIYLVVLVLLIRAVIGIQTIVDVNQWIKIQFLMKIINTISSLVKKERINLTSIIRSHINVLKLQAQMKAVPRLD